MLASEIFKKLVHGLFDFLVVLRRLARFPQPISLLLLLSTPFGRDDIPDDPFHADPRDLLVQDGGRDSVLTDEKRARIRSHGGLDERMTT